jgi:large subunit ribosomal protein L17
MPRTAGVAALKRLFDELGKRYAERPGGYTRIIRLGRRDGDNAELAIIELVDNPREREAADSKKAKSATGKKKSAKAGGKAETSSAESTKKKETGGGRRSKKTESTAAEQETE